MPAVTGARTDFRQDIQGLRAVAVLLVVAFHIGLPIAGFIGVDVFFVISGFVITTIFMHEVEGTGTLRLGDFWKRRFFRLMPALALLVTSVMVIAWLILLPLQRELTSATGVGAMLFVANVVIARNTGGYFDPPAEGNPLLNTWSLSVEEQFYLVFPVLLVVVIASASSLRRKRVFMLVAIAVVSMCSLLIMLAKLVGLLDVTWLNFYDPVQRAWEFGVGSLLALLTARGWALGRSWAWVFGGFGSGALVAALLLLRYPIDYPNVLTLLPVLSTVLVLAAGSVGSNPVSRLLSLRPMVRIGDASYSIYLWHWPVISFAVLLGVEGLGPLALLAGLSFVPAYASYRWLETPLRKYARNRAKVGWRIPVVTMVIPIMAAAALWIAPRAETGVTGDSGLGYLQFIDESSVPCETITIQVPGTRCRQSEAGVSPRVVVLGDSHGEHLFAGILLDKPEVPSAYIYLEDWPSIISSDSQGVVRQIATSTSIESVIVSARWNEVNVQSAQLPETLSELIAAGKRVVVLDDVPYFDFHAMECEYARFIGPKSQCTMPRSDFDAFRESYVPELADGVEASRAEFMTVGSTFCTSEECSMVRDGVLQYADNGHLNIEGSRSVIEALTQGGVF